MTACQQTCPTHAITFGNLKDEASAVTQAVATRRARTTCSTSSARGRAVTYLKKVVAAEATP